MFEIKDKTYYEDGVKNGTEIIKSLKKERAQFEKIMDYFNDHTENHYAEYNLATVGCEIAKHIGYLDHEITHYTNLVKNEKRKIKLIESLEKLEEVV